MLQPIATATTTDIFTATTNANAGILILLLPKSPPLSAMLLLMKSAHGTLILMLHYHTRLHMLSINEYYAKLFIFNNILLETIL